MDMPFTIDAEYVDGQFRPLSGVKLPENARVRLTVQPLPTWDEWLAGGEASREMFAESDTAKTTRPCAPRLRAWLKDSSQPAARSPRREKRRWPNRGITRRRGSTWRSTRRRSRASSSSCAARRTALRVIPPPFPPRKGGKGVRRLREPLRPRPRRALQPPLQVPGPRHLHRRRRQQAQDRLPDGQVRHGRHRPGRHVGQRPHLHRRRAARLPRLPRHAEGRPADDRACLSRASATAAWTPSARSSAARPRSCPTSTSRATSTWPASPSASSSATASSTAGRSSPATR